MLTVAALTSYLVSIMASAIQPERLASADEPAAAVELRFAAIAEGIADAAADPDEAPVAGLGRVRTAVLLLSVSYFESGWRRAIDLGVERGDRGRSCTVFQLNVGKGRTPEGWSCDELLDRRLAARAALGAVRRSQAACRRKGPESILWAYVSGQCDGDALATAHDGAPTIRSLARKRTELARRWQAAHPWRDPSPRGAGDS